MITKPVERSKSLLGHIELLLLDFDGPLTPLMPTPANAEAAAIVRKALVAGGIAVPGEVLGGHDHIAILRAVGQLGVEAVSAADRAAVAAEVRAAQVSPLTPGAREVLEACQRQGVPVVVVSNNAASAVRAFLDRQELCAYVAAVVGRPFAEPGLMKPNPHLVREALHLARVNADRAAFVGDSVSDIEVARAVGVASIGYAKHLQRGQELADAGADYIIESMAELAETITTS